MSATIESDLFSMYFAVPVRGRVEGAPVVTVEGKSFPVVECYLDDLQDIGVSTLIFIETFYKLQQGILFPIIVHIACI